MIRVTPDRSKHIKVHSIGGLVLIFFVLILPLSRLSSQDIATRFVPHHLLPTQKSEGRADGDEVRAKDAQEQSAKLNVASLVSKALAFKNTLSSSQKSQLQQSYTPARARKWSHLNCAATCRNGIALKDLNNNQLTAALAVIKLALGRGTNNGYDEFQSLRVAEDYLKANGGGNSYGSGLRWIAYLNTPSTTGSWMLQIGGNHFSANIAFRNGHVIGVTPYYTGVEPTYWTYGGKSYEPMKDEIDGFRKMLASFNSGELAYARYQTPFLDVIFSPGESNNNPNVLRFFRQRMPCSFLHKSKQALVLEAISNYTSDLDADVAAAIMQRYEDEIDSTYITFTGNGTPGNPNSFLNTHQSYVRIDGPSVFIELSVQSGHVFPTLLHYHSLWRDHHSDYGNDLNGSFIDVPTSTKSITMQDIQIFPNPASNSLNIKSSSDLRDAIVIISDIAGREISQTVLKDPEQQIEISGLYPGLYTATIAKDGKSTSLKFVKQ